MSQNEDFNWQSHCGPCQTKCCRCNSFVVDKISYENVLAAGHPDYLTKIEVESETGEVEVNFVNDYRNDTCPYHDNAKGCTIQNSAIKFKICSAFPGLLLKKAGNIIGVGFDNKCPATRFLDDDAKFKLAEIVYDNSRNMTAPHYLQVMGVYESRNKPEQLDAMRATVTSGKDRISRR